MQHSKLIKGSLIKRYKRFLADINLEGQTITAHCPNSGSMKTLDNKGDIVYVSERPNTKLKYRWELIEQNGFLISINTYNPNHIVKEAIKNKQIAELNMYTSIKSEVKYGIQNSRIDLLLENEQEKCFIEIKNTQMKRKNNLIEFPDAITARGAKHLEELIEMKKQGHRAIIFFLAQREDCQNIAIAKDIDENYYQKFIEALNNGVECIAYNCKVSLNEVVIKEKMNYIG